jgi:hypothetical protein
MVLMRPDTFWGAVGGGGLAREIESFWALEIAQADRRVPVGAKKLSILLVPTPRPPHLPASKQLPAGPYKS